MSEERRNELNKEASAQSVRNTKRNGKKVTRVILIILAAAAAVFLVRTWAVYRSYKAQANEILMNMDEGTFRRAGNTFIYDADGGLIGEIGNEKYEYVSLSDVSDYVIDGYVSREDKRFYEHSGIDVKALARAGLAYIENHGGITQGGSTITQQVVKNNLLTQEQTFDRKFIEILLALRLEREYTKDQIMEFYVNSCYYGSNCYGIEGAAEYYFGKSAKDLTLSEAAMLVATSNSPNAVNPAADYDACRKKRDAVLDDMEAMGYITEAEKNAAEAETHEVVLKSDNVDADNYMITYAIHCAALKLMADDGFGFLYTYDSEEQYEAYTELYNEEYNEALYAVRGGGYKIYTSFDLGIQDALQAAVDEGLSGFTDTQEDGRYKMQGAAVCVDNSTGMVVACVGGRGVSDSFNRGYQAYRQPGSSIKPLLDYGPALDLGVITPATVYNDARFDDNGYSPQNAGGAYYGNVTCREAIARSLNTVALHVMLDTGRNESLAYLSAMHFSSLTYADQTADAVSIGGMTRGVTVCDMAKGYAALANGGTYTDADCIVQLVTEAGDVIYDAGRDAATTEAYHTDAAFMVTDMMEGGVEESYGTAHAVKNSSQAYAAKTGTTNDNKDAWLCGYSKYYTCAVWVGCDTPESVSGLSGGKYPAAIWSAFMDAVHEGLDKKEFTAPDTVVLMNASGDTKTVDYTKDVYSSRPSGWDYASTRLLSMMEEREKEKERQAVLDAAQKAVREFEEWQIASYEDALELEARYNAVLEMIAAVDDAAEREALYDRAAYKYELLSGEVADAWADAEDAIKRAEQDELDAGNALKAAESLEAALKAAEDAAEGAKAAYIDVVEAYIKYLNQASYYTDAVERMIDAAYDALSDCSGFTEYRSLKSRLDSAAGRAGALPDPPSGTASDIDLNAFQDGYNTYGLAAYTRFSLIGL